MFFAKTLMGRKEAGSGVWEGNKVGNNGQVTSEMASVFKFQSSLKF